MGEAWDWIKAHPVIVIGGLGVIVLFYLLSNSGSSSGDSAAAAGGPSDAEVNAGAQVNIAQLQAQAHGQDIQASLSALSGNNATQITLAGISAGVQNYQTEQSANVAELGINAQRDVQTAGLQTQQIIALANDATQVQMQSLIEMTNQTRINAVRDITNAPYAVQVAQLTALGPGGLADVIKGAERTKNSYLSIGGITAGRNTPPSQWGALGGIASGIGSALAAVI